MAEKIVDAPVGVRYRTQNTTNKASDQDIVLTMLSSIPDKDGGKEQSWPAKPLAGPSGTCPQLLQDAIWDFQTYWKKRGIFHNIDGVCDPFGHTANLMKSLVHGKLGVDPPVKPDIKPFPPRPRIGGTWQVTNMWSISLGEGGLFGMIQMEITQPDDQKFHINATGFGFGVGIDLLQLIKVFKAGGALFETSKIALQTLAESLGRGLAFNIGDWFQLLGGGFGPLTATAGVLTTNPINEYIGNPTSLSRYTLCGGVAPPPIYIANAGGGVVAGMEGGVIFMGTNPILSPFGASAIGCYGSSGVNMKFGIGAAIMAYGITSVGNGPGDPGKLF